MAIENLQPMAYGVSTTFFILGTVSIFLRLYTRGFILKTFGWDDVMAVFLLAVNTTQQVIFFMFFHYGTGIHIQFLSARQIQEIVKLLFVEELFYYFMHWVIKQAFLLFYLRLSPQPAFQRLVWGTMGLNTAFCIINWLLAFLQCIPFNAIFHPENRQNARCINTLALLIVPAILNIITDLIILTLPIRTVWSLQMSTRRKIAVLSVIGFGAAAVLIAGLRIILIIELSVTLDLSYVLGKMIIVAAMEIEFAVIAVNLPSVKALWNKVTGDSSADSHGGQGCSGENQSRGYKLSSFKPGSKSGDASGAKSGAKSKLGKSRGSVTVSHLQRGSESEEELFRQAGIGGKITVTTKVAVISADRGVIGELEREDGLDAFRGGGAGEGGWAECI